MNESKENNEKNNLKQTTNQMHALHAIPFGTVGVTKLSVLE